MHKRRLVVEKLARRELMAGDIDFGFGNLGLGGEPITTSVDSAYLVGDVAIDDLGRAVLATSSERGRGHVLTLHRLTPAGLADTAFGSDGLAEIPVNPDLFNPNVTAVSGVAIQSSGRIVLLTSVRILDVNRSIVPRLVGITPEGQLDTTFGNDGFVDFLHELPHHRTPGGLFVSDDDSIYTISADTISTFVTKHDVGGHLDGAFGIDGVVEINTGDSVAQDITPLSDGSFIAVSMAENINDRQLTAKAVKISLAGIVDTQFADDGFLELGFFDRGSVVQAEPFDDGGFLVGTIASETDGSDFFRFLSFDSDGQPDTSFGINGQVDVETGGSSAALHGLTIDDQGGAVLVGRQNSLSLVSVSVNSSGVVDQSQSTTGINLIETTSDFRRTFDTLGAISRLPNGDFISMHSVRSSPYETINVLGIDSLGNPTDYGTDGIVDLSRTLVWSRMDALQSILLPDGGLLTLSSHEYPVTELRSVNTELVLQRLLPNGLPDASFGDDGWIVVPPVTEDANDSGLTGKFVPVGEAIHLVTSSRDGVHSHVLQPDGTLLASDPNSVAWSPSETCAFNAIYDVEPMIDGLLISAYCDANSNTDTNSGRLYRIDKSGNQVLSFGDGGVIKFPATNTTRLQLETADGNSFVTLFQDYFRGSGFESVIQKHQANGVPDLSFGEGGQLNTGKFSPFSTDPGRKFSVNGDGEILLLRGESGFAVTLSKYTNTGIDDPSFGVDGTIEVTKQTSDITPRDFEVDENGSVIVATVESNGLTSVSRIHRYDPTGQIDLAFGDGGSRVVDLSDGDTEINDVYINTPDELIVSGSTQDALFRRAVSIRLIDSAPQVWHNTANPSDTNLDNSVTALDALIVINYISQQGRSAEDEGGRPEAFYDVNQDGFATAVDALIIINDLNRQSGAEPEGSDQPTLVSSKLKSANELDDDQDSHDLAFSELF